MFASEVGGADVDGDVFAASVLIDVGVVVDEDAQAESSMDKITNKRMFLLFIIDPHIEQILALHSFELQNEI